MLKGAIKMLKGFRLFRTQNPVWFCMLRVYGHFASGLKARVLLTHFLRRGFGVLRIVVSGTPKPQKRVSRNP